MNKRLMKGNIVTATIVVAVLLIGTIWSLLRFHNYKFITHDNKVRLLLSEDKSRLEKGIYEQGRYPYLVFDLEGVVRYSDMAFSLEVGDKVNQQEMLQYDESFTMRNRELSKVNFILEDKGKVTAFAVFLVPKYHIMDYTNWERALSIMTPSIWSILIGILIILTRVIYANMCIFAPIVDISRSANAIIMGNYDVEVVRVYGREIKNNEVGQLIYSFELMRDELKQKQIKEEELKKSQQELISCISHDLKTPLSTIKAYSEGLLDLNITDPNRQKEYVNVILNKTDLLIEMIEELLIYSNAQLNKLDIKMEEIYIHNYLKPLILELEHYIKQNGIEFKAEINVPDVIILMDPKRITEVIYNLVENSLKYIGKQNGIIQIRAEKVESYLLIKILDNGIGISVDDIPYVFDKFYRSEKSRNQSIPGSGLGLSICKYIIEEHHGEIYCKSRYKEGCEIGFTLPI